SPCTLPPYGVWDQYLKVHEQLRRQPIELALSTFQPGTDLMLTIDHRRLDDLLFAALYSRETRPLIATVLRVLAPAGPEGQRTARAQAGHAELADLLRGIAEGRSGSSRAVKLSHICRDEAPFDDIDALAAAAAE